MWYGKRGQVNCSTTAGEHPPPLDRHEGLERRSGVCPERHPQPVNPGDRGCVRGSASTGAVLRDLWLLRIGGRL